jgi:hypothetical protein
MIEAHPKPKQPMGEAWFMGEVRQMYPELLGDLDQLTDQQIYDPLEELASGLSSFGLLPEWVEWYNYLMPRLLLRPWAHGMNNPIELLATAFFELHPAVVESSAYAGFGADVMATLGRFIMAPEQWPGGVADHRRCLDRYTRVDGTCGWYEASGLLSASIFLGLKYLPVDALRPWLNSVLAIEDPYWKQQVLVWLVGVHPLLTGAVNAPAEFPEAGLYRVAWDWSHLLDGRYYTGEHEHTAVRMPFVTLERREIAAAFARDLDVTSFFEELLTNPSLGQLALESYDLHDRYVELWTGP